MPKAQKQTSVLGGGVEIGPPLKIPELDEMVERGEGRQRLIDDQLRATIWHFYHEKQLSFAAIGRGLRHAGISISDAGVRNVCRRREERQ